MPKLRSSRSRSVCRPTPPTGVTSAALIEPRVASCAAVGAVITPVGLTTLLVPVVGDRLRKLRDVPLTCGTMGFSQPAGKVSEVDPAPTYGVVYVSEMLRRNESKPSENSKRP